MKTPFKVGDPVYCIIRGWGKVKSIVGEDEEFPVVVNFGKDEFEFGTYTLDGRYFLESEPTLSFTEYTLKGFSQERPIELPEVGEEIVVSNNELIWSIAFFEYYEMHSEYPVFTSGSIRFKYFRRLR